MDTNPLAELKDVHLPADVSLFPLAPGWYIVFILIIFLAIGLYFWKKNKKERAAKLSEIYHLLDEIELNNKNLHDEEILAKVSVLLKRVTMTEFPKKNTHLLYGKKWLTFLDSTGNTKEFSTGAGKPLGESYQKQKLAESEEFFNLIRKWLRKVL